ncbi:hypothetical protein [Thermococcus sp. JCM 11816]
MDEYEVQVYGSTYVLEAFVNLEGYVEELKLLKRLWRMANCLRRSGG